MKGLLSLSGGQEYKAQTMTKFGLSNLHQRMERMLESIPVSEYSPCVYTPHGSSKNDSEELLP